MTAQLIETLNNECFCISLDTDALRKALESEIGQPGLFNMVRERCPYLFAARPVFVSQTHMVRMAQVVRAMEAVVSMPAYREKVLAQSPAIARHDPGGAKGVFFGYDFHVTEGGFGLIEVNTNAGGALLNAVLARAQRACCPEIESMVPLPATAHALEESVVAMFRKEWDSSGRGRPLRSIAIVDEAPQGQYLYPEFLLFQQLFHRHGMQAVIADPSEFILRDGVLWHGDLAIDLVYNRLTDFYLHERERNIGLQINRQHDERNYSDEEQHNEQHDWRDRVPDSPRGNIFHLCSAFDRCNFHRFAFLKKCARRRHHLVRA